MREMNPIGLSCGVVASSVGLAVALSPGMATVIDGSETTETFSSAVSVPSVPSVPAYPTGAVGSVGTTIFCPSPVAMAKMENPGVVAVNDTHPPSSLINEVGNSCHTPSWKRHKATFDGPIPSILSHAAGTRNENSAPLI
jgi:hypothetical protein